MTETVMIIPGSKQYRMVRGREIEILCFRQFIRQFWRPVRDYRQKAFVVQFRYQIRTTSDTGCDAR